MIVHMLNEFPSIYHPSLETGPPPSGQLNAGVRRREGLARRPYRVWTRAEILARVSGSSQLVLGMNKLSSNATIHVRVRTCVYRR